MRRQVSYANNTSSSLQQLNPCVYFSSLTPSGQVYQGTSTVDFRQPLSTINPSLQIARPTHHHLKRPSRDRPIGHPSGLKQQQQDIDSLIITTWPKRHDTCDKRRRHPAQHDGRRLKSRKRSVTPSNSSRTSSTAYRLIRCKINNLHAKMQSSW